MKYLLILVLCFGLIGCVKQMRIEGTDQYTTGELSRFSPTGLVYGDSIGVNWWSGTFDGKPVLIHAVQTYWYVNIDLTFIPKESQ